MIKFLYIFSTADVPCTERGSSDMISAMEDAKSCLSLPLSSVKIISKSSVYPDQPSTLGRLNLSVFDVRLLFFHYFQMGLLFHRPIRPSTDLLNHLRSSLSRALSLYPPLAGRLATDDDGSFFIACNDAGVDFVHADAPGLSIADIAGYDSDVPDVTKELFLLNGVLSLEGCSIPLTAVQVTELADGVFVSCSINHAVVDGTSFMNFMNSWSELCRGIGKISQPPDFNSHLLSQYTPMVPRRPPVGLTDPTPAIRDRVFRFSREAIQGLKARANSLASIEGQISSFQSLCAQLWRSVTRARSWPSPGMEARLWLAANCRNRMEPPLGTNYFGNAIMTIFTAAKVEEVQGREVGWCAQQLHRNVAAVGDEAVRREMEKWKEQKDPRTSDGPLLIVAWSPSFPIYGNDMGWGRPVAAFSGTAQKLDGLVLALPGSDGGGSIDLELCLVPETMARLESDGEFMQYVAGVRSKKSA